MNNLQKSRSILIKYFKDHRAQIAMGAGIGLMAGATVTAVPATIKAVRAVDAEKQRLGVDKLPKSDIFKISWKHYVPTFILEVAGFGSVLLSGKFNADDIAAAVTACKLAQKSHEEYRETVEETQGSKQEDVIFSEVARKTAEPVPEGITKETSLFPGKGTQLCYDYYTKRYFWGSPDIIKDAKDLLNDRIYSEMFVSANDFYSYLDLEPIVGYDSIGFNSENGSVKIKFTSFLAGDNTPVLTFRFSRGFEPENKW